MSGLNGIIVSGKVYEAVEEKENSPCIECDLSVECDKNDNMADLCFVFGNQRYFRFSQELTDKINEK